MKGWKHKKTSTIIGNEKTPTKMEAGQVIINKKATKKYLDKLIDINNDGLDNPSTKVSTDGTDGGILKGKPHYDENGNPTGGIPVIVDGGKKIEVEGEEFVVNKEASQKHWKELSKINQSAGNGVPINPSDVGSDEDPEEFRKGGIIEFNPNHLPNHLIYSYAKKVKEKYPKVWDMGGNIFGNEAFKNLERVIKRGYWTENEEWMYIKWRSYVARHHKDFRIAGTIAMLKWVDKTDKGWPYMKALIEKEIAKKYPKKGWKNKMAKGGGITNKLAFISKNESGNYWLISINKKGDNYEEIDGDRRLYVVKDMAKRWGYKLVSPKEFNDYYKIEERIRSYDSQKKMAEGGGIKIMPQQGTLLTKDKKLKLDYKRNGNDFEFVVYEGENNPVANYTKTSFKKKQNGVVTMDYNQFIDYIYSEGYIDDKNYALGGGIVTYKNKYNKKYGYDKDERHDLKDIAKDTGVSEKGLQQIYNKGVGAYKTNPQSVRPTVKSKEQWAMARVYSAVMGGKAARVDANELKMENGGGIEYSAIQEILNKAKPFQDELTERWVKAINEEGKITLTDWDIQMYQFSLVMDLTKAIGNYLEKDDLIKDLKFIKDQSSIVISCVVIRDGVEYNFSTEVILAGGYNIQKLHLRYIVHTKLDNKRSNPEYDKLNEQYKRMTKAQKLKEQISFSENAIAEYEVKLNEAKANSKLSDSEVEKLSRSKKPDVWKNIDITWEIIIERGADKNFNYDKSEFERRTKENKEFWIQSWKTHNSNYGRYEGLIKSEKKQIEKLNKKIAELGVTKMQTGGMMQGEPPANFENVLYTELANRYEHGGLIAPNGKKSNLTPEQYKLVRTPEFKKFFGDWENDPKNASKIVDENGEPLVVYHASYKDFNAFDWEQLEYPQHDRGYYGKGFYFTNSLFNVKQYGSIIKSYFLDIKNPFYIPFEYQGSPRNFSNLFNDLKNFEKVDKEEYGDTRQSLLKGWHIDLDKDFQKKLTNRIKEWKYDGVDVISENEIVAFYPNQIKLANGSNTTFNANNDDIRYKHGGNIVNNACIEELVSLINSYSEIEYWDVDKNKNNLVIVFKNEIGNYDIDIYNKFLKGLSDCETVFDKDVEIKYDNSDYKTIFVKLKTSIENGGAKNIEFMKWFVDWYKTINKQININFSVPNILSPFKEDNVIILDLFEKINQDIDAKPYLNKIIEKADDFGVVIYLEPTPRYKYFLENAEKRKKISKDYLIKYYKNFGFELTQNGQFMKRVPKMKNGGTVKDITCTQCGWAWNKSDSEKHDEYVCHKCGTDNEMKNGGVANDFDKNEVELVSTEYLNSIRSQDKSSWDYDLENSIEKNGIKEPVTIAYWPEYDYVTLIDGHHRLDTAIDLGLEKIPTKIQMMQDNPKGRIKVHNIETFNENAKKPSDLEIFKDGGAASWDKLAVASSRFRPVETIVFDPPLIGENGTKLLSYTWAYEMTMQHNWEGELVGKRVSDWTQADISAETGRGIVHKYTLELPDGSIRNVSSESVPILLGYVNRTQAKVFGNLATASKTLAKQQMKLAILEAQKKEYDELYSKFEKAPKPEITLAEISDLPLITQRVYQREVEEGKGVSFTYFKMGDVIYSQDNNYNYNEGKYIPSTQPDKRTIEALTLTWISERVKEAGGVNPRELYDLKNRVARQKRKVEQMLKTPSMADGGTTDDFDWESLFNTSPEEQEKIKQEIKKSEEKEKEDWYQGTKFSKEWAATYKDAINKTVKEYLDAKATYEDWGSRQYKSNKGVVYAGGDDIHGTAYTIGGINEYRRKKTMAGAKMLMDESIETLKDLRLTDEEISNLLNNKMAKGGITENHEDLETQIMKQQFGR